MVPALFKHCFTHTSKKIAPTVLLLVFVANVLDECLFLFTGMLCGLTNVLKAQSLVSQLWLAKKKFNTISKKPVSYTHLTLPTTPYV